MGLRINLNKLSLDEDILKESFRRICEAYINLVSDRLQDYFKKEIDALGNGSGEMKKSAKKAVKEVVHEVVEDHIKYDVGITEETMREMGDIAYVRIYVVLHGNTNTNLHLWTRPGEMTFTKHVAGIRPSPAEELVPLPFFEQPYDVAGMIKDNAMYQVHAIFKDALNEIARAVGGNWFSGFVRVS